MAGSFLTKSFARFKYKFLNNSDIVRVSKANLSFALIQISEEDDFFSVNRNCINVFQGLLGFYSVFCSKISFLLFPKFDFAKRFELICSIEFRGGWVVLVIGVFSHPP